MASIPRPTAPMEILTTATMDRWRDVLTQCPAHDFHHLPEYHAHAEAHGEGSAHLLVLREREFTIAVPLLLRSLAEVPGLEGCAGSLCDATSVYGYAGPIASHPEVPDDVRQIFADELERTLRSLGVVTVFSRLHPLFDQQHLLSYAGDCVSTGRTLSLDLTPPVEEQFMKFRRTHRRGLKKLRELGLDVIEDRELAHLDEFVRIYTASMRRVGAAPQYYFDREYFRSLVEQLGPVMRLFLVRHGARIVAASLHSTYNGIVQGHLGGTADHALEWSPDKLLIDEVRLWAAARGYRVFHHGGGVGAREDTLYQFKAGFSDTSHEFRTWRWIIDPAACRALCESRARWNLGHGLATADEDFFPSYRAPSEPMAPIAKAHPLRSGLAGILLGGMLAEAGAIALPGGKFSRSRIPELPEEVEHRYSSAVAPNRARVLVV